MVRQKEYNAEKGARLRKAINYIVYKENLMTKQDVAKLLDKDYSNLSKALKGDPLYIETYIEALCNKYELFSKDWFESGVGDMLKEESHTSDSSKVDNSPSDFVIDENTVLYHYTSLKGFMGIIGDGMLRFGLLKNSNDLRDSGNNSEYKYISFCLGNKKQGYDKPRMWSQYGRDYEGVCIGFYLNKLLEYNQGVGDLEHFKVEYLSPDEIRFLGNSDKSALKIKHQDWAQENEYRFVSKKMEGLKFSYDCIYCVCAGINVTGKELLTQVGLNSKMKPMMRVSGVLRDGFLSIAQDVEFERNGKILVGKIKTKADVDEETGRANAKRFYRQLCAAEETPRYNNYTYYDSFVDGAIPLYKDLPVSAGKQDLALIAASEKPSGWIKPAEVLTAIGAFPVVGCSMEPFIHQGDFITVAPLNNWDRIDPDKTYMVITQDDRMIKHLVADEDDESILWCISPNYPKFKILKNEIKAIFRITFHGKLM